MNRFANTFFAAAAVAVFGFANPNEALACRGIVGDFVWTDSNGNGIQDAGEAGINGVVLRLTHNNPHQDPRSAVTANHPVTGQPGWYQFDRIDCMFQYTITVDASTVPAGYSVTTIHAGSDPAVDSNDPTGVTFSFPLTETNPPPDLTIDFGYLPPCVGAIGDFVWNDVDRDGLQDPGEAGIAGAIVQLNSNAPVATEANGSYSFVGLCGGTYTVCVQTPAGLQLSPSNAGNDALDSDGISDGAGKSCATVTLASGETNVTIDFGFNEPPVRSPGTGTPGYWKNHPEAWPVDSLVIGGVTYTQAQILANMTEKPKDKTTTVFRALVAAKLNVLIGNEDSCVASTIASADAWMAMYGPVGSGVTASSLAWRQGEPLYRTLDNYNNGMLCAPSRD